MCLWHSVNKTPLCLYAVHVRHIGSHMIGVFAYLGINLTFFDIIVITTISNIALADKDCACYTFLAISTLVMV